MNQQHWITFILSLRNYIYRRPNLASDWGDPSLSLREFKYVLLIVKSLVHIQVIRRPFPILQPINRYNKRIYYIDNRNIIYIWFKDSTDKGSIIIGFTICLDCI